MTYELCKKLKDAGFTQKETGVFSLASVTHLSDGNLITGERCYQPTLSELIEACHPDAMDGFILQTSQDGKWEAGALYAGYFDSWPSLKDKDGFVQFDLNIKGATPEEAVAKLWLSLNNK